VRAIWPQTNRYMELSLGFFEGMLRRGIAAGEYREHDARARALALMNALDGVTVYLITSPSLTAEQVAADFARVFLDELRRDA
jgi:QacR-like protein, C-terminal region